MKKNSFVVYRIKNTINGRVYFGSTRNFKARKAQHLKVMAGQTNSLPNYLRDIQNLGHRPEDFTFRILASFDNELDMFEREQTYLDMYWGTACCYNTAHEVQENWVTKTYVAWNMKTLEVRQYLSCHAIRKDVGISKRDSAAMLAGNLLHRDFWVIETWGKRRTVAEVVAMYQIGDVQLPAHALQPRRRKSITPIPGVCSISELVYRKRFKVVSQTTAVWRNKIRHNHDAQFW